MIDRDDDADAELDDAQRAALARYDALAERGRRVPPEGREVLWTAVLEIVECGNLDVAIGLLDELIEDCLAARAKREARERAKR